MTNTTNNNDYNLLYFDYNYYTIKTKTMLLSIAKESKGISINKITFFFFFLVVITQII